ncbi:hypothetical protein CLU79DRAFT_519802 [Phycomyces nitens]|nr:hypothetical protein CLU79DRAFT_519802 [Phycomyces nitens]
MSNAPFNVDETYHSPPNWHVVNCTTPSQYFHVLRRQMARSFRKPLVVISPKSLLKSPLAVSSFEDMAPGTSFKPVLEDPTTNNPDMVEKVVFVSGKLYYDLAKEKTERGLDERVALVRIEELCPFPRDQIKQEIEKYEHAGEFVWCQEEPQNAGAYSFMAPRLAQLVPQRMIGYVGRGPLSAPAIANGPLFRKQQSQLIQEAIDI